MKTAERIYKEAQTLPETQAKVVLDFLVFLKSRLQESDVSTVENASNDDVLPGFGMWADCEDKSDSTAYVNEIRSPRYKL